MSVCERKKKRGNVRPKTKKARKPKKKRKMPFTAAWLAPLKFFSPKLRDKSALTPTPVPTETAIIRFCTGKASETAVKASSLIRATKMLSTTLYKACMSMEAIIGTDIESNNLLTGIIPILFSVGAEFLLWFINFGIPFLWLNTTLLLYYSKSLLSSRKN